MIKFIFLASFLLGTVSLLQAQTVLERLKDKARNRGEQRLDEGMEKGLDKVEEGAKSKASKTKKAKEDLKENDNQVTVSKTDFKSYSRYDFVPGNNMLLVEDFSQDVIGEFPLKWTTNNRGEVVTVKGSDGNWLRMYQSGQFLSPSIKKLPDNYTIEFDMILFFDHGGDSYVYPDLQIKLLSLAPGATTARNYLKDSDASADLILGINPSEAGSSSIYLSSQKEKSSHFSGEEKGFKPLDSYYGKPMHFAIWVQKERYRCWINGEKMYDVPQAVPPQSLFNHMDIAVGGSNYQDEKVGFYISNIRIAEAGADMRSKFLTEGKLVTNGILFDVNAANIKPESAGILREIAAILKENPGVKVKIVGHTDTDGDDAKNLDLSKRRAAAVKEALAKNYGIEAARMETDGMGESSPVSDNNTTEGKAQNRRVEFIKL